MGEIPGPGAAGGNWSHGVGARTADTSGVPLPARPVGDLALPKRLGGTDGCAAPAAQQKESEPDKMAGLTRVRPRRSSLEDTDTKSVSCSGMLDTARHDRSSRVESCYGRVGIVVEAQNVRRSSWETPSELRLGFDHAIYEYVCAAAERARGIVLNSDDDECPRAIAATTWHVSHSGACRWEKRTFARRHHERRAPRVVARRRS